MIITGKNTAPSDVTGFTAVQDANDLTKIKISWNNIPDLDLKGYRLYLSGVPITDIIYGNSYVYTVVASGTYAFNIKSIDTSGNYSVNFSNYSISVTIPSNYYVTITAAQIQMLIATNNALSATKLQNSRNINGVSFDGTHDITVTAVANGGNSSTVNGIYFRQNSGDLQYSFDGSTWFTLLHI